MKKPNLLTLSFIIILGILGSESSLFAQKRRVIQLSGIVTDTSNNFLPGVHIYVPKAGRGTSTNGSGFFSMPVLVGDSVVISSIGFWRKSVIVPDTNEEYVTWLIELQQDVTTLNPVIISPIPTEEFFKKAIMAMDIPLNDTGIDQKNLNSELIALMVKTTPMDGAANYKYYINQWSNSAGDKFHPLYNPFLNPLNWAKFIKDLKKKKKG